MSVSTGSTSPRNLNANLLDASLATASSLVVLQLLSRLVTFGLNQALVRLAPPEVFGTAAIQFELLLSTILFLSREGVRNALLRSSSTDDEKEKTSHAAPGSPLITNISLLPILLGIPIAALASVIYRGWSGPATRNQPNFDLSVTLYVVAAFLELLSEPLHIRAQNELRSDIRLRAQAAGVILKGIATLGVVVIGGVRWALPAFAIGQAVHGLVVFVMYSWAYRDSLSTLLPRKTIERIHGNVRTRYFDDRLLWLSIAMSVQSVVKHFLTEGDRLIVSRISQLKDQGGYAVATNYGSLVARIVFQPMEETSRLFFSKTLSTSSVSSDGEAEKVERKTSLQAASDALHTLLLLDTHISLLLITFGPPYVPTLLSFLLPARYMSTSASLVLTAYCSYLPIMAFNGILEAFFSATTEQSDLQRQSRWMIAFSVVFILASAGFMKGLGWGETGLVWANSVNLACRAVFCWVYIRRYFRERGRPEFASLRAALPPAPVMIAFLSAGVVVRLSQSVAQPSLRGKLTHIGMGGISGVICIVTCLITERKAVSQLSSIIGRRR